MNEVSTLAHATIGTETMNNGGYVNPIEYPRMMPRMGTNNNGRDKLPWSQEIWNRIDQAVHDECYRTKIARKFLPLYGPVSPADMTVPSDTILNLGGGVAPQPLTVNEAATIPLIELLVEFTLTLQQVEREAELMTAVTLATRAANLLSQAEDIVIFQGQAAIDPGPGQHPLFANRVRTRSGPAGAGLLAAADTNRAAQVIPVNAIQPVVPGDPLRFGEGTFAAVSLGYSRLQNGAQQAHYGPYALVLHNEPYADTFAPLRTTLIMPADRIKPLMTAGFSGTGTLRGMGAAPELRETTGLLVSLGGNTMDLVVGTDAMTAFLQEDTEGRYRFRVYERFALRVKDTSSVIRFEFQP